MILSSSELLASVLGRRDDAACRKLVEKTGIEGRMFVTGHWEGFQRTIPHDQLFTGKELTYTIEQDSSNIRHYLARFRRRTKVVSKSEVMVDLSWRLHHHLRDPENYSKYASAFLSILS